ncbi:ABC transporter ATP-binding protein/permease [Myxococcota bacterium]|nr:ABC transporter ATP-binding protein/permease [Myxococcota bacterium]
MQVLLYFARHYRWQSIVMVACLVAGTLAEGLGITSVFPLLNLATGVESDAPTSHSDSLVRAALAMVGVTPTIGSLLVIICLAFTLRAVLVLLAKKRVGYTVAHTATDLRLELLRALMATRWNYFTRQPVGSLANSMATEADRASEAYLNLSMVIAQILLTGLYVVISLIESWQATLMLGVAGASSWLLLNTLVRISGRAGRRQTHLLKSLLGRLTDSLQAVKVLKSMGREKLIAPLLEDDTHLLNRQLERRVFSREAMVALQEPIVVICIAVYLYVAVVIQEMAITSTLVLVFLLAQAMSNLGKIQRKYQLMKTDASALWSIRELIDRANANLEDFDGTRHATLERSIELRGVCLAHEGQSVLRDVELDIPAREITALVGQSGSGKTTLVDLITGLLRADSGDVRIDGVAIEELDQQHWRERIGYVSQEMLILNESIRVNISLGDPAISKADVERALRDAGAWDFVEALPEGMETKMGERGALFSGGQRQRISIARALVHQPKLLILDEATAALDDASEAEVWNSMRQLRGRTTIIAISHQPALANVADRIYRVEDGGVTPAPRLRVIGGGDG